MTMQANKYDKLKLTKEQQRTMDMNAGLSRLLEAVVRIRAEARSRSVLTKETFSKVGPVLDKLEEAIREAGAKLDMSEVFDINEKSTYNIRIKSEKEQTYEQVLF